MLVSYPHQNKQETDINSVLNLSSIELTEELSKGMNFVPTVHINLFNTLLDVNKFVTSLTLKKHFLCYITSYTNDNMHHQGEKHTN